MKFSGRPLPLTNAPLQYAPNGEMGVVYLFANIAKKLLMYRGSPACSITDIFRFCGTGKVYKRGKRKGKFFSGDVERICKLDAPIFLDDMRNHKVLRTSSFNRSNMQGRGGLLVSEYWPHLYAMLCARNPKHRRAFAKFAPEKLSA
jgi:hypothetical protein